MNELKTHKGKLYDPCETTKDIGKYYNPKRFKNNNENQTYRSQKKWRTILTKEKYNTLVTIQPKMKNKYMFEKRMQSFSDLHNVQGLFYSVEQNADKLGYHIHLMFKAFNCDKMSLSFALGTPINTIQYYEQINDKVAVSRYVTKNMKGDQIHYNFY